MTDLKLTEEQVKDFYFCHARKFEGGGLDLFRLVHDLAISGLRMREGWVMVPRERTNEMKNAGYRKYCEFADKQGYVAWRNCLEVFDAMLAATPKEES